MSTPTLDWAVLLQETRGYLGLSSENPVPKDELVAQAKANGYTDREIRDALRETDSLENVGTLDNPAVVLTDPRKREIGESAPDPIESWQNADFANTESGVWPPELLKREQWMGHVGKKPFAPWADSDHPEASEDEDARWKWGITDNYADGETIAMAEDDSRLDGRAFLQQPEDPYAYVDGDDVRDPETGEVHPKFRAILHQLGFTYGDISQSGAGAHALYKGELPEGVKQAAWRLDDDPWGENTDLPSIEIYAGKRVCVATGEHITGTPESVNEWDADALEELLDENDQLPTERDESEVFDRDEYDLDDYTPNATGSGETTDEIRDVFAALDRLDVKRVADRTIVHRWNDEASTSDDARAFYPTWGKNSNGTANYVNDKIWHDTGDGGGYGGPVVMALIHAGEMSPRNASPRDARGELWMQGVDHLRELGFDIPEYAPASDDAESVAVLPETGQLEDATSGWDWRHTAEAGRGLSIEDARGRTTDAIADAYESHDRVLVEALPTMGKSYGSIKAAAETGEQITIVTGRGRKEQYDQFRAWCDEFGLSYYTLPAFTRDCDTANGEHGQEWAETVRDWYRRGATPKQIHASAEYVLNRPLPCQEHEGQSCPYASKWDFDPDDYDVLIGHYSHAHKPKVVTGRTVVFDEFPDAYETTLGVNLQGAVSYWLSQTEDVPFEDYTDLLENRGDSQRRSDALAWFLSQDLERDETHVFDDGKAHAAAPLAVFAILAADNLGNGFEATDLEDTGTAVRNRQNGGVALLQPPALDYASGVVALDGTPTKEMWELALGTQLNHRPVLADSERGEYLQDALNLNLVRTTDAVKPYNSTDHVNTEQDAALLEKIRDSHGEKPSLITTSTAEHEYDESGVLGEYVNESKHYGNVLGSNEFRETRLGAVIGSNHYGDHYIKKWGAYAGETVSRDDKKGAGLSYGRFGDKVLAHMREHDTLQAAMRFGRDGNGAVVYVHTDTLPEWVPLAGEGRVVKTWSDGMRQVLKALEGLESATTAEIVDHPSVDLSRQQVSSHLNTLYERGVLDRGQDPEDGRRVLWQDDGLHRVNEHGDVDLEPVELDDLTDEELRDLAEHTTYTWAFASGESEQSDDALLVGGGGEKQLVPDGGDGPPDGGGGE